MLNTIIHGPKSDLPTLIIAHGLFGSARNWGVIAKRLSEKRQVIAVDMRNHGDSFHSDRHLYPDMAADLAEVIAAHSDGQADVIGHSMGGKAAMVLAITDPAKVRRLIVADIAPVAYGHSQQSHIDAMRAVDLTKLQSRADAHDRMAGHDPAVVPFLLQSLDLKEKRWTLNLDTLAADMAQITGFPEMDGQFHGPTLFLSGAASDYVLPAHRPRIKSFFPQARFAKIPGAGHWLHAEQPRAFVETVGVFLDTDRNL